MRYSLLLTAVGILGSFTYLNVTETCGCNGPEDTDTDGYCEPDDCDLNDPQTYPGAPEVCDGKDNSCDGVVPSDEVDADKDGVAVCNGDCDDLDPSVKPGVSEACDGKDTNCDGVLGSGENDADGDGVAGCADDCNDNDANIYPGAPELCDGLDNNCDGQIPTEEKDNDKDGFTACEGDCDDSSSSSFPGGVEVCDGKDQDCDGLSDVTSNGSTEWVRSVCGAVLTGTTGSFDQVGADQISVYYNGDKGIFEAWYRATDASKIQRIAYASSVDGVKWTKSTAVVLNLGATGTWDAKALAFPSVVIKDNKYVMYYHGQDANNKIRIGRAESTDGKVWVKDATPVLDASTSGWDSRAVSSPTVVYDEEELVFKMWYTGSDGTTLRTGYASSIDGKVWTKHTTWVVDVGGTGAWDSKRAVFAKVHKDKGAYHLFYSGDDTSSTFTYEVGYAFSTNGINFTKLDDPVLSFGATGQFDSFMVYAADVIPTFDGYSMYYSGGVTLDGPYSVGLARNAAPYANLVAPAPSSVYRQGERVEFAVDSDDLGHSDLLTAYFMSSEDGLIGVSAAFPGVPLTFATNDLTPGDHTVQVMVFDRGGLMDRQTVDITVY